MSTAFDPQPLGEAELNDIVGGRALRTTAPISATETNFIRFLDITDLRKKNHGPQPDPAPDLGRGLWR